jgi:hypothetical protein
MAHSRILSLSVAAILSTALLVVAPAAALAHNERPVTSPTRPGGWPVLNRRQPHVVVCKATSRPTSKQLQAIRAHLRHLAGSRGKARRYWRRRLGNWRWNRRLWPQCRFHNIQAAVNAVKRRRDILVMPGVYREKPSRQAKDLPADNSDGTYSYAFQRKHPNAINLVGIVGKPSITLRGTGYNRKKVVVEVGFAKHVGIRADRSNGFIARDFTVRHAVEHGLYTIESNGYLYDNVAGLYSGEYQLFGFASDHGLIENCEAVGGGDSGIYVGGSPDSGRINTIVQSCRMHHNVLGFSGTNSDWVLLRHNYVYDNATGIVVDAESDHPNYPPAYEHITGNWIWNNNFNVYSRHADVKPIGFTANTIHAPVGTAIVVASFSHSLIRGNWIWNNHSLGVGISSIEALDRGAKSEFDRVVGNWFTKPGGVEYPNGIDLFWDGLGKGNCWDSNYGASTSPQNLPQCDSTSAKEGMPSQENPDPDNIAIEGGLIVTDSKSGRLVCNDTGTKPCPSGPGPKNGRNTRKGGGGGGGY